MNLSFITAFKTKGINIKNRKFKKSSTTLINEKGKGILNELAFLSDVSDSQNKEYSLYIKLDGLIVFDYTFDECSILNNYVSYISCFEDVSYYVLSLDDFRFEDSIVVQLTVNAINGIMFNNITGKIFLT